MASVPIPLVTRVLVADDHELVRKGLQLVLAAEPDLDVVAEAADGEELELLTPRELEVLKLIAEGHSSKEIATTLVLSIKTVESHRANILNKLGMRDRVDLTRYAIRRGLIEP